MRYRYFLLTLSLLASYAVSALPRQTLTLEQAVQRVLQQSPELATSRYQVEAAQKNIQAAALSPAYSTNIEFENIGMSDEFSGKDMLETTLSLSKIFELGDKSGLRGQFAQQQAAMYRNEHDTARLDIIVTTARQFITILKLQHMLSLEQSTLSLANDTLNIAKDRVRVGKAASTEKRRAQITYTHSNLNIKNITTQINIEKSSLSALWGNANTDFSNVAGNLFELNTPDSLEKYKSRLSNNPDLIRLTTASHLAEARIRLAKAQQNPDIEFALGVRHFNETDDQGLLFTASIPLGTSNRAEASVTQATLLNKAERFDLDQQQLDINVTLYRIHQLLLKAHRTTTALRENIIPEAEKILDDYTFGYRAGRYSFLELSDAKNNLLKYRLQAITAATDYQLYQIEIDRLTGVGMTKGTYQ